MKKTMTPALILSALLFTFSGCGSDSNNPEGSAINLPDGKTMIFFDKVTSRQYNYNTDTDSYKDMNVESNATYNMQNKNGTLFTWFDETPRGVDQKIVMFNEDYNLADESNITYEDFHYLGHFHEEDNVKHFAAHSNEEFNPEASSAKKKKALKRLNAALAEREEIREELTEVLPAEEKLCNFFVFKHDHDEDDNITEEAVPHIALTESGKVYVYNESNGTLSLAQSSFALDGMTECTEESSAILKNNDHGVLIFSSQSQKLYLVDEHGMDFHQHSTWNVSKFLPSDFIPTSVAAISDDEEDHDH